ncbi:MAG: type I-C CRISPR-associated protein Cas7/Csd2 [Thermoguttaceae bacterium]|nr:type I-C CRISPR-associated protein Cas7/Csd2 [Thermoguttaceae bacterium]
MTALTNKIDFVAIISVENANPNGDPLNGNSPREDYEGFGLISDVCIKRKLRNRFQDMKHNIFVQMSERTTDGYKTLKERAEACNGLYVEDSGKKGKGSKKSKQININVACSTWLDVRSFGQVFAFSEKNGSDDSSESQSGNGVSVAIRGPVSIRIAKSVNPIRNYDMQITKSVAGESESDTMGTKHFVDFAIYVIKGSVNCQLAELTGFSEEDAQTLHDALKTLFENDASSARPEGSMEVCRLYWWKHDCQYPQTTSAMVHRSVEIFPDGENKDNPRSIKDYRIRFVNPENCVPPDIYAPVEIQEAE